MNQTKIKKDRGWLLVVGVLTAIFISFTILILGASGIRIPAKEVGLVGYAVSAETLKGSIFNQYQPINRVEIRPVNQSKKELCVILDDDFSLLINAVKNEATVEILYSKPLWLAPWQCRGGDGFLLEAKQLPALSR